MNIKILMLLTHFLLAVKTRAITSSAGRSFKGNLNSTSRFARRNMRVEIDGHTNTVVVHPDEGKHSASIILLHGKPDFEKIMYGAIDSL